MPDNQPLKDQTPPSSEPPSGPSSDALKPSSPPVGPPSVQPSSEENSVKQNEIRSAESSDENNKVADPLAQAYEFDDEKASKPTSQPSPPESTISVPEITDKDKEPKQEPEKPSASKIKSPPTQQPSPPGKKAVIKRSGSRILTIIISVIVILAVAGIAFYLFFYRATLTINPKPTPDLITLDNNQISSGTYRINPGRHQIVVKKQGYVSYAIDRNIGIGEKINIDFTFEKQPQGKIIANGASNVLLSSDQNFIIYQGGDGRLYSLKINGDSNPEAISQNTYQQIRTLLVSQNNQFALLLDKDALRIIDFKLQDLVSQTETNLPPLASAIGSVTWNSAVDNLFTQPNEHIIYDIKTDYGWDLILANRSHTQSEILMQIDKNRFDNIKLDWTSNPKKILVAGGELGIIDLPSRSYSQLIKNDQRIVSAKWSPHATRFAAMSLDEKIYTGDDTGASELDNFSGKLYGWVDDNQLAAISEGRLSVYRFDTEEVINYAEINGLESCQSFAIKEGIIYFADSEGLKSASLQLPKY